MKLFRLAGLLTLVLLGSARADLTVVQKVASKDGDRSITLEIKGDKARVQVSPQITTIIDAKTGDIVNLMSEKKMVVRIPGDKAKAMAEMAQAFAKEETPDQSVPKATGKKQTINGYETQEYVSDSPKFHASYWVATSYPDYKSILQQMSVLKKGAFASITKNMPDYNALPGLPLRTEIRVGDQAPIVSTIESVKTDALPDADFTVPEGYSEMKLPDIFGGQKPSGTGTP